MMKNGAINWVKSFYMFIFFANKRVLGLNATNTRVNYAEFFCFKWTGLLVRFRTFRIIEELF